MLNHAIPVENPIINIPQPVAASIVSAVHGVGDFMREELARLNLISDNHKSGLLWSKLNTNVHDAIGISGGRADVIRAGYHQFLFLGHEGFRITFMRESRFLDVQKDVKVNGKLNYQNVLVQLCNNDLEAEIAQMAIDQFPMPEYDEAEVSERFRKLFGGVLENVDGRYVMVLFEIDSYYELRKIRAVIVEPNFDIVEEQDWSHYIPVKETVIAETVSDAVAPDNNPSRGMTLKPKALDRKIRQNELPPTDEEG